MSELKPGSKITPKCDPAFALVNQDVDSVGLGERTCQWNGEWYSAQSISCESLFNIFESNQGNTPATMYSPPVVELQIVIVKFSFKSDIEEVICHDLVATNNLR